MQKLISEEKKKRILYQSTHRGCKETDILLGNFVLHNIEKLSESLINKLEILLQENDEKIYGYITNHLKPPALIEELIQKIVAYNNEVLYR